MAWETALHSIPDRAFTTFLLRGITHGFRIGVQEGAHLKPVRRNLKSAYDCREIISAYIQREVDLQRMTPLLSLLAMEPLLGLFPKQQTSAWSTCDDVVSS